MDKPMSKAAQKILAERTAERIAAAKITAPAAPVVPTGPNKYSGMSGDGKSMLLANIIFDPDQPRKKFDEKKLAETAATMASHGVLQPIIVRWVEAEGKWMVVAGERRVRAARLAGLTSIPCQFMGLDAPEKSEDEIDEIQLIENIHREGLKPSEQAAWIKRYMERHPAMTQKEIAIKVRLSEAHVSKILAASELPAPILDLVDAQVIPLEVGVGLSKIKDDVQQAQLADKIVREDMDRMKALAEVKRARTGKKKRGRKPSSQGRAVRLKLGDGYTVTVAATHVFQDGEVRKVLTLAIACLDEEERGRAAA